MEPTTELAHVYPAESAWDEEETLDRPRPGYVRVSDSSADLLATGADEVNSDLGNSGRDSHAPAPEVVEMVG